VFRPVVLKDAPDVFEKKKNSDHDQKEGHANQAVNQVERNWMATG